MELRSLYKKIKLQGINSTGITKAISDYIVENIKQRNIEALSLKKIAKNCNVSDATITRYCKELGYSGFIPFKKHLDAINTNYVINNHEVIINRSLVESTEKFYDEYVNIYNRGRLAIKMLIKNGMIDRIASLLKNCQRIFIAGNNINYSQTIDFKNHLIASGFNVLLE
ncbi:MurR/RpiR family transcriptional regulator [Spiroplasma eriocheiris]|uniref:RpiR family transcriptional regulator n=1 Tax=Spiroplasma eriocheiris TaxID=315358 RepID=A0A0H3XJY2_9MOLU|nr:MurR/RpiR family transcriptional regulator [Spiroplasma eriocheiris]AHF57155.1 putative phosphosugar-binding transcriptional regulator [Spiroplasma eriocheiris CCTCC M 207170]AKM53624.1 RpiR family transcriptional regulator [Spiroplasma eriocheiris]